MAQILSIRHVVDFKSGASFSDRESLINSEASKIMTTLRGRGFYPLGFEVVAKMDTRATVIVNYQVQ